MKMISCVIRPEKLDTLTDALERDQIVGMTVMDVRGFGRQKGDTGDLREGGSRISLVSKVRVDLVVYEHDVRKVMETIVRVSRTGKIGDGKIFVLDVLNAMRVRTGEKGALAL